MGMILFVVKLCLHDELDKRGGVFGVASEFDAIGESARAVWGGVEEVGVFEPDGAVAFSATRVFEIKEEVVAIAADEVLFKDEEAAHEEGRCEVLAPGVLKHFKHRGIASHFYGWCFAVEGDGALELLRGEVFASKVFEVLFEVFEEVGVDGCASGGGMSAVFQECLRAEAVDGVEGVAKVQAWDGSARAFIDGGSVGVGEGAVEDECGAIEAFFEAPGGDSDDTLMPRGVGEDEGMG